MKEKIINILKLSLCFSVFYFLGDILAIIIKLIGLDYKSLSDNTLLILQLIGSSLITCLLLIFYRKDLIKDFKDIKTKKINIGYIIKMFLLFMIVKYIVSFISILILMLVGLEVESITSVNQTTLESYVKINPILMIITVSILAPLYEEILFRLGIRKTIKNKPLFIIVSGSIFGLLHIFPLAEGITLTLGLIQSITYVTMGIFLALIYAKTDNIFNSIGIHFLNNFLSILVLINTL